MTSMAAMRQFVKDMRFRSKSWAYKVDKMADPQVVAIYMKEKKRLEDEKAAKRVKKEQDNETPF